MWQLDIIGKDAPRVANVSRALGGAGNGAMSNPLFACSNTEKKSIYHSEWVQQSSKKDR